MADTKPWIFTLSNFSDWPQAMEVWEILCDTCLKQGVGVTINPVEITSNKIPPELRITVPKWGDRAIAALIKSKVAEKVPGVKVVIH